MAKDGTNRGGARVGAGRKTKALNDKIREGRSDSAVVLPEPASFNGEDVPPVKEYLRAQQKNGKSLAAAEIFEEVYLWLKQRGCDGLVSRQLIEQYAMTVSRSSVRSVSRSMASWQSIPPQGMRSRLHMFP